MVWAGVAAAGATLVKTVVGKSTEDDQKGNKNQVGKGGKKEPNATMVATNQLLDPAANIGKFLE